MGEIENIIPDYTHQSQTVVARRPAHSASAVARLADNGLSASSTSSATSTLDSKLPPTVAGGGATVAVAPSQQQITSRMDTFPIDTPLGTSLYPSTYGSRYLGGSGGDLSDNGGQLMLMRQASSVTASATTLPNMTPKSNKQPAEHHSYTSSSPRSLLSTSASSSSSSYQLRSGHQAIPKGANQSQVPPVKQRHNTGNLARSSGASDGLYSSAGTKPASSPHNHNKHLTSHHNHHWSSSSSALQSSPSSSSSTISSSGNNLLTSASSTATIGNHGQNLSSNNKKLTQLPLYENQRRIMYQPVQESSIANPQRKQQLNNVNRNVNPYVSGHITSAS